MAPAHAVTAPVGSTTTIGRPVNTVTAAFLIGFLVAALCAAYFAVNAGVDYPEPPVQVD